MGALMMGKVREIALTSHWACVPVSTVAAYKSLMRSRPEIKPRITKPRIMCITSVSTHFLLTLVNLNNNRPQPSRSAIRCTQEPGYTSLPNKNGHKVTAHTFIYTGTVVPDCVTWKGNLMLHGRPLFATEYQTIMKSVWPVKPRSILRKLKNCVCVPSSHTAIFLKIALVQFHTGI